jgi:general secretion pathway protein D
LPLTVYGEPSPTNDPVILSKKSDAVLDALREEKSPTLISFSYKDEDLINIINLLAAYKEINILLPHGVDAIKAKVTIHFSQPLTLDDAWKLLSTLLYAAGYTCFEYASNMYEIVKISPTHKVDPFPLYIGMDPQELPDTENYIRYIYYTNNLRASSEDPTNEIVVVLQRLLPQESIIQVDNATNAVIVISSAAAIKSAMKIIAQLDKPGFQEKLEIMQLTYASAADVAVLFNDKILQSPDIRRYRFDTKKSPDVTYFSPNVKIVPDPRTNRLIIRGRAQAIERIRHFITTHIDVDLETGESILHVYQLRYLVAEDIANVIQSIVSPPQEKGGRQSTSETISGGTERYFGEVIVRTDAVPAPARSVKEGEWQGSPEYGGGNKLIIAARSDDWKRIKKLLDELDKPHRQVLIEVLIADLTLDDNRMLNSMMRNPARLEMPANIAYQSSHEIGPGVLPNACTNPQTIGLIEGTPGTATPPVSSDLLRNGFATANGTTSCNDAGTQCPVNFLIPGSAVLSISDKDGSTWGIMQLLKVLGNRKVISYPHFVATHNQQTTLERGQQLLLQDAATTNATSPEIKIIQIDAKLKLQITPRVSSSNIVNLQIQVTIDDFINTTLGARLTREVTTSANVHSTDILAIGGLTRVDTTDGVTETPFLSKIPILGNLVKGRRSDIARTNLTVFICPTILEPRFHKGLSTHSHDYVTLANKDVSKALAFSGLKDPVTRWFFGTENPGVTKSQEFLAKDPHTNTQLEPAPVALLGAQSQKPLREIIKAEENPFKKKRRRSRQSLASATN